MFTYIGANVYISTVDKQQKLSDSPLSLEQFCYWSARAIETESLLKEVVFVDCGTPLLSKLAGASWLLYTHRVCTITDAIEMVGSEHSSTPLELGQQVALLSLLSTRSADS